MKNWPFPPEMALNFIPVDAPHTASACSRARDSCGPSSRAVARDSYALKDLVAVAGYKTAWGARPYAEQIFDYNATIVERLNHADAVLIGKAAMIELAGGLGYTNEFGSLTGRCKNPWKNDSWTGGSSSGSGAVLAAGLAPRAPGSDTRGSIIFPSSWSLLSAHGRGP